MKRALPTASIVPFWTEEALASAFGWVPWKIPQISAARRWLYTGQRIGAQAAFDSGFLDAQAGGPVLEEALAFGADMLENAPLSIAGSKAQLNAIAAGRVAEQAGRIQALEARANASEDYRNAAEAIAAKRKPVFTGR